jgi:PleD family two-component response regulator
MRHTWSGPVLIQTFRTKPPRAREQSKYYLQVLKGEIMNAPATSASRRVLFIHSDRRYAQSCEDLLESAGFEVTLASNSTEALDCVSSDSYGVIILPPSLERREEKRLRAQLPKLAQEPFAFQIRYPNVDPVRVVDFVRRVASL